MAGLREAAAAAAAAVAAVAAWSVFHTHQRW